MRLPIKITSTGYDPDADEWDCVECGQRCYRNALNLHECPHSVEDAKAFKRVAIELRIRFPVEIQYNSEFEAMVKRLEGGSL